MHSKQKGNGDVMETDLSNVSHQQDFQFFFVLPEKNTSIRTSLQYKLEWRMFYSSILDKLSIKSKSSYFAKTFCNSGLNSTNYTESLIFRVNSRKFYTSTACDARDKFHV